MRMNFSRTLLAAVMPTAMMAIALLVQPAPAVAQTSGSALTVADSTKLLPASVFFRGQSATTQLRNSGGVKFSDGMFVLATLVDTSGYSSDVQQKYQAYFITEVPIKIEGHDLPAGIYGVGFIPRSEVHRSRRRRPRPLHRVLPQRRGLEAPHPSQSHCRERQIPPL